MSETRDEYCSLAVRSLETCKAREGVSWNIVVLAFAYLGQYKDVSKVISICRVEEAGLANISLLTVIYSDYSINIIALI